MGGTDRTPEEQAVIDSVAEHKSKYSTMTEQVSREWAEDHSELILLQAERVGELKPEE